MKLLAVFIGGGLGSLCRYGIAKWIGPTSGGFPTATLVANVLSCLVLGATWLYVSKHTQLPEPWRLFIMVGFCGGFSTFSTFSLETFQLMQDGQWVGALLYVGASVFACLLIFWALVKSM
ncbi:MAG: fluoride efflux transporter CrcB [Bacteroidota bacterium]